MPGPPMWKPAKGSATRARRARSARARSHETREKASARHDQGDKCRVPWCLDRAESAHLDADGYCGTKLMGGDRLGARTRSEWLIRFCRTHHQGRFSLHSRNLRVEYLSPRGTKGPIRCWARENISREDWYVLFEDRGPVPIRRAS